MIGKWSKDSGSTAYQAEVGPFILFVIPCNAKIAGEPNPYAGLHGIRMKNGHFPLLDVWSEVSTLPVDVPELMRRVEEEFQTRLRHISETLRWDALEPETSA
jgi:hypothetical protein